jgi:hypothetical protein
MLVRLTSTTYSYKKLMDTSKVSWPQLKRWRHSSKQFGLRDHLLKLKDSFFLNFAFLFMHPLILNREGLFVPSYTEAHYLLHLAKLYNPNFLQNDWTFSALPTHFVFNVVFGPLTLLFPLEVVGWIGRILSYSLILVALLQLGRHFRIPLWMITGSILLWLLHRQSIVGGEWILGTFEAKSIAYALLFFSLNGFMGNGGIIIPSSLLGLAFSFHPAIGLWAALSVGLSLVVLRYPIDVIIKFGCCTTLFALPGLAALLVTPFESGLDASEALKFICLVVMPYHFDPFFFGKAWQALLVLPILLCFNLLHFRLVGKGHSLQFLMSFQAIIGLFFVLGFIGRYIENYNLLLLMPCRLFPVLLPLFFLLTLMSALHHCHAIKYGKGLVVLGLVAFASYGSPIHEFVYSVGRHYSMLTRGEEDVQKALKWIANNTPTNSIIISPPWRSDSFYLSRRGQIAAWAVPRFDRVGEWRERLQLLVGDVSGLRGYGIVNERIEHMASHYNALTATDIASLSEKYGAEYLLSSATYSYPVLFQSGTYKVYSLKGGSFILKSASHSEPVEADRAY